MSPIGILVERICSVSSSNGQLLDFPEWKWEREGMNEVFVYLYICKKMFLKNNKIKKKISIRSWDVFELYET